MWGGNTPAQLQAKLACRCPCPRNPAQKCSECGHLDADNKPSQAVSLLGLRPYGKNILGPLPVSLPEKGAAFIEHREPAQSGRSLKQGIRSRLVA